MSPVSSLRTYCRRHIADEVGRRVAARAHHPAQGMAGIGSDQRQKRTLKHTSGDPTVDDCVTVVAPRGARALLDDSTGGARRDVRPGGPLPAALPCVEEGRELRWLGWCLSSTPMTSPLPVWGFDAGATGSGASGSASPCPRVVGPTWSIFNFALHSCGAARRVVVSVARQACRVQTSMNRARKTANSASHAPAPLPLSLVRASSRAAQTEGHNHSFSRLRPDANDSVHLFYSAQATTCPWRHQVAVQS
jgi:hypothetical protein